MKALSKTEYEKRRFAQANQTLADSDITAATLPLFLTGTVRLVPAVAEAYPFKPDKSAARWLLRLPLCRCASTLGWHWLSFSARSG